MVGESSLVGGGVGWGRGLVEERGLVGRRVPWFGSLKRQYG